MLSPEVIAAQQRVRHAYDPELFREAGQRLVVLLADYLGRAQAGAGEVLTWADPEVNLARASAWLDQAAAPDAKTATRVDAFAQRVETMLRHGLKLHDPRYIGHQVPASVPLAGWFDAVGAVTNQAMAIYEMGPWATAVEAALVARLGAQIGWDPGTFAGLITHGGSLANLTALLTARNVTLGQSWQEGLARSGTVPALVVHADAHYSVARAAGILGLGAAQVCRVGLDAQRRIDPRQLDALLIDLRRAGRPIVAVVACACATPIGAFDPLEAVADICQHHRVWLHVDAAHGGAACFSARHRHLLHGLARADSVVWDAHKMLFVPALCAFVLYRQKVHRFAAFDQQAPYLFDPTAPQLAEFDSALRTVECTKRAAAYGLWGLWSIFGPTLFADLVDVTFGLGQVFYRMLRAAEDFEPVHLPQANIVVFRHLPPALRAASPEAVGDFQLRLRRRLVAAGEFYIVATRIDGTFALRVAMMNPLTTPEHLHRLLATLRDEGARLLERTTRRR